MAVVFLRHRCCPTLFVLAAVLLLVSANAAPIKSPTRLRLGGPGSSPPTCRSKCGSCSPCTAVHVPIQPGLSFPLEYYPEAWRCKCANSLFMP